MTAADSDPLRPPAPPESGAGGYFATTRGEFALWTGVLGGPVAWSLQQFVCYVVSHFSRAHRWLTGLHHVLSLLFVAAAVAAALLALREWRRLGQGEPRGTEPGVPGRSRFLALLGVLSSGYFAVVILAQWVPVFFWDPGWY